MLALTKSEVLLFSSKEAPLVVADADRWERRDDAGEKEQ